VTASILVRPFFVGKSSFTKIKGGIMPKKVDTQSVFEEKIEGVMYRLEQARKSPQDERDENLKKVLEELVVLAEEGDGKWHLCPFTCVVEALDKKGRQLSSDEYRMLIHVALTRSTRLVCLLYDVAARFIFSSSRKM
jgi:predicted ArsR family transcriptional regulator